MYELIVIGTSWGGFEAVSALLDGLHDDVHQPIIVAQHRSVESEEGGLARMLALHTRCGQNAAGIVLTSANSDGADGLARIKERGVVAIVQEPTTSIRRTMPDAAIAATTADAVLPLAEIPAFLYGLCA